MTHDETDFEPTTDGGVSFERTYNSSEGFVGLTGERWTSNYNIFLYNPDGNPTVRMPGGRGVYFTNSAGTYTSTNAAAKETLTYSSSSKVFTLTTPGNDRYYFYGNGKLKQVTDAKNLTTTFTYSTNKLTKVTDTYGNSLTFTYPSASEFKVSRITRSNGYYCDYTYTGNRLSKVLFYKPGGVLYRAKVYTCQASSPYLLTSIKDGSTEAGAVPVATWTYDGSNRATSSSIDGTVNKVTLVYNTGSTEVTNARGETTTYAYATSSGVKKITSVTGPGCSECPGAGSDYTYDASGSVTSKTDRNGNVTEYSGYDSKGNPATVTEKDDAGNVIRTSYYTYNNSGKVKTRERRSAIPFGAYTTATLDVTYSWDKPLDAHEMGNTRDIDGSGVYANYSSSYTYDSDRMTSATDPRGHTTAYAYYPVVTGSANSGRQSSTTNALGHTVTFGNYSSGKAGWVRDANGILSTTGYDARGRVRLVTMHDKDDVPTRTTSYGHDAFGNMTTMHLPRGNRIGYGYDAANRLTRVSDGIGNYIVYEYDNESNRTREEIRDSSGTLLKYRDMDYDEDGRPWKTYNSTSNTESLYDGNGNLRSFRDYNGHTTTHTYDALDRLMTTVQPPPMTGDDSITTGYTYDINDNVTSVTDGNGHVTTYVYDDLSRLIETNSPDTGLTRYEYDAAGNLVKKKDAMGTLVTYEYDALNRLTGVHFPDPTKDIIYTYDSTADGNFGIGRMTGMADPSGTTTYFYDEYGGLLREVRSFTGGPSLTTQYSYDDDGNQETMTYPDGRVVTYSYDATGRVSGVTSVKDGTSKTFASNVRYLPFGPVASYTYGSGLTAVRTYDLDGRLRFLKSGPMVRRSYGYDNNGNITSITDLVNPAKSQSFTYDALDRLRTVSGAYGNLTYDYDAVGNRIGGGDELVYDENGNVIGDGALEFEYEAGAPVPNVGGSMEGNLYAYVAGNPLTFTDPKGLKITDGIFVEPKITPCNVAGWCCTQHQKMVDDCRRNKPDKMSTCMEKARTWLNQCTRYAADHPFEEDGCEYTPIHPRCIGKCEPGTVCSECHQR